MKIIKRVLLVLFSLLVLMIAAAVIAPILFKDEIVAAVKKDLNKNLNATVDFVDVDISLLRSFPQLRLSLEDMTIDGQGAFSGQRLLEMESFAMKMDLMSVLKKSRKPEIEEIIISNASMDILVLEDGKANYDIVKTSDVTDESDESAIELNIKNVELDNVSFRYLDRTLGLDMAIGELSGNTAITIDGQQYLTENEIQASNIDYSQSGVSYLNKAKLDITSGLDISLDEMLIRLRENSMSLNALDLVAEGSVDINDDHQLIDIKFKAPGAEFKQFLSLLPSAYTKDFDQVKTKGKLKLDGYVKGRYDDNQLPAFEIDAKVDNASFQYPGFTQDITDLFTDINVKRIGNLNSLRVDAPRLDFSIDQDKIHSAFLLENVMTDPHISGEMTGNIDLAKLKKAYPMPDIKFAEGILSLDIKVDAKQSDITAKNTNNILADGSIKSDNISFQYGDYPRMELKGLQSQIKPESISLDVSQLSSEKSIGKANVLVKNYLGYLLDEGIMDVNMIADFDRIESSEFLSESSETTNTAADSSATSGVNALDRIRVNIDGTVGQMSYENYEMKDINVDALYANDILDLKQASLKINGSDIQANGELSNLLAYYYEGDDLKGTINMNSQLLDLNALMPASEEGEQSDEAEMSVIAVPENMEIDINAKMGRILYSDYDLRNASGDLFVQNQTLFLEDFETSTLGGKMNFSGSYETPTDAEPAFRIKYDMKKIDFNRFFNTINTFDILLPVGKFIDGVFNSSLVLEGNLKDNLFPDLNTLTGQGFLGNAQREN